MHEKKKESIQLKVILTLHHNYSVKMKLLKKIVT